MKRKRKWLLCPLIIVALLLCAIPAYADIPTMPHPFYGTVTIDESPAAVGTVVTAKVGGVQCGSITTTVAGQYGGSGAFDEKLLVSGEIATGATISFYVNDVDTTQTYAFSPGADPTELNLTAEPPDDTTPPTVNITALSPDPTNDNTPTFTGTATDTESNISSVEYKVDDGAWTAATASDGVFDSLSEGYTFTTAELSDGANTVYVRATDAYANTTVEADYATDSFTVDTTPPTVTSTSPVADATDVAVDTVITATFSEAMDASTITTSNFTVAGVSGSVSYDSGSYTATFTPSANLSSNTTYTATLSTAITDAAGNPLAEYSWSFSTPLCIPGDANEDGVVNALDITKVERIIATLDPETCGADANEDGTVNALDITKVEIIIVTP
jgi:hypothetical protein